MNQITRPQTVSQTQPALLPVPIELYPIRKGETNESVSTQRKNSTIFQAVVPGATDEGHNDSTNTLSLAILLSFPTAEIDVAVIAK